ncbi:hypothetical protein [Streptomyces sp. NBC_01803]|uniref:hypothetical protein n=1 Tax=Streptomyces sp. NBC_01803 TaxID=2975946 RepID=UPI002DDAEA41|nr:hypothetical protein [Streptomyces sp. NBC_01803]WSA43003.1 hypothetical protein OIE51_01605 [Streptomyces sp. NBC_01803]
MRVGLISGDGLPVSGLLTIFRNVRDLGREMGLVEDTVPADLGFTWRPDKPGFFPHGPARAYAPDWLVVENTGSSVDIDWTARERELSRIRADVARHDELTPVGRTSLEDRIEAVCEPYRRGFLGWLEKHRVDWVFALNMTLSDAVPVTLALHRAAAEYYATRPGGVLFWDHDLFGSCAIHDEASGARLYPEQPNRCTPVPRPNAFTRWAVVSESLAREARSYPTGLTPDIVPNILPRVPDGPLGKRHHALARQHGLVGGRPILLAPVRVFGVKGVEVAIELTAAMKSLATARSTAVPYLLVFGSLTEDPLYAAEVMARARHLGMDGDVIFLDGVPLASFEDPHRGWQLDEVDLLRLAQASAGGVVFTPGVTDVETVGLAPGLAAIAGLPVAVTAYEVFRGIYGEHFSSIHVGLTRDGIRAAAAEFLEVIGPHRTGHAVAAGLERNRALVRDAFSDTPWRGLLRRLARAL